MMESSWDGTPKSVPKFRIVEGGPGDFYIQRKHNWFEILFKGYPRWRWIDEPSFKTLEQARQAMYDIIKYETTYPIYHYD